MSETYDIAVIGGGHNGLTCACYLAKAGLKMIVLERRHITDGAVCTQDDLIEVCKIHITSSGRIPYLAQFPMGKKCFCKKQETTKRTV